MPANVVSLTNCTESHNRIERPGVIFNVQPIPDLIAFTVNRQWLTCQGIQNHQRNELLREVKWAIVI